MTFFTYSDVPMEKVQDKFCSLHRLHGTLLIFAAEQRMDQPEVLFPDTACQKACGPYAGEACRKDMHQEPAYEFIRVKFHGLPCIGRAAVILVPEADTVVIKALHPVVGDGCPVGIPGKVGDGIIRVLTSGIMRIA